jgi:hypothetical protein
MLRAFRKIWFAGLRPPLLGILDDSGKVLVDSLILAFFNGAWAYLHWDQSRKRTDG